MTKAENLIFGAGILGSRSSYCFAIHSAELLLLRALVAAYYFIFCVCNCYPAENTPITKRWNAAGSVSIIKNPCEFIQWWRIYI